MSWLLVRQGLRQNLKLHPCLKCFRLHSLMRNKIETREKHKTIFTASEVREQLREQYLSLKKQYEDAVDDKNRLLFLHVSPLNALRRAKNIFARGDFDKLNAQQKSYEETLKQFARDKSHFLDWKQNFNNQKSSSNGNRFREQYYLTKKKFYLEETERKLAQTKIRLDKELTRLENLCKTETAKEKIAFFSANLLFKNLKISQYETAKKLVSDLSDKIQVAKKRFYALNDNYSSLKKNYVYRVIQSVNDSAKTSTLNENELTGIIADALLGEQYAVELVARSSGNNLEMDKDWELMSELDRDEFIHKKIVREL